MGFILLVAIGFAALRAASDLWARLVFSLALLVLSVGTLGLFVAHGPKRSYWLGFCLLGWGYMIACFGPWCFEEVQPRLITTWALERAAPWIVRPRVLTLMDRGSARSEVVSSVLATPMDLSDLQAGEVRVDRISSAWPATIYRSTLSPGAPDHVLRIGHSLVTLGIAILGGWITQVWSDQNHIPGENPPA